MAQQEKFKKYSTANFFPGNIKTSIRHGTLKKSYILNRYSNRAFKTVSRSDSSSCSAVMAEDDQLFKTSRSCTSQSPLINNNQLVQLLHQMQDAVCLTDNRGIIEYCSSSHKHILGYDINYLLGKSIFDFVHPKDLLNLMTVFDLSINSRAKLQMTSKVRHADGKYVCLETQGQVLHDDNGKTRGMVLCCRDVSFRLNNEKALLLSREKISKAFLCNPLPITISTFHEGRHMEVNDAFLTFFQYEKPEIIGRTSCELNTWVNLQDRDRILDQILKQGSVRDVEINLRVKSGEIRTVLLFMENITIDEETFLLSIINDITERKQAENALRQSEESFAKAFNASPVTMCVSTLEDGRMLNVNHSFCRLFGYNSQEMIGHSTLELGIWTDASERLKLTRLLAKNGSVREIEVNLVSKSGEVLYGQVTAENIIVDGQLCILSHFTDMTEKKRMENEITRLDRLNLVGQMAASIGHEIRNPMTTVRGFLQVMKARKKFQDDCDTFDLMIEELDRANSIITEFLSLARNKLIKPEISNLNIIITNMLPLCQVSAMAQDKSVKAVLEEVPDLLLDQKEIRQLMHNLVQNGLESMEAGGNLLITTSFDGQNVIASIHDQGHGIDQAIRDYIGTPFFTTKEDGTGLGLAICYGIANRHKAVIDIDPTPEGTTFRVSFPLPAAEPE